LTSYCSTWTTPCRRVCFLSPPSRVKATSRRTTYPNINMIHRWKREKSAGDQNYSAGVFPSIFQNVSYDDFCQTDCVISVKQILWFLSNRFCDFKSLQSISIGVWEETYIQNSAWSNGGCHRYGHRSIIGSSKFCTYLSSRIFSNVSLLFFFFVLSGGLFAVLKEYFPLITILSLSYAFIYFILFFT
jgi:hypothetical protein